MDYESSPENRYNSINPLGPKPDPNENRNTYFRRSIFIKDQWYKMWKNIKKDSYAASIPSGYSDPLRKESINPYLKDEMDKFIKALNEILK